MPCIAIVARTALTSLLSFGYFQNAILSEARSWLQKHDDVFSHFHNETIARHTSVKQRHVSVVESNLQLWRVVNEHVIRTGEPLRPVKFFQHGVQVLYSKLKGGVDGMAQQKQRLGGQRLYSWASNAVAQLFQCRTDLRESGKSPEPRIIQECQILYKKDA